MVVGVGTNGNHKSVVLTQLQAESIQMVRHAYYDHEMVKVFCGEYGKDVFPKEVLDMSLEKFISALYVGFTVEKTPEEQFLEWFETLKDTDQNMIHHAFEILKVNVKNLNK